MARKQFRYEKVPSAAFPVSRGNDRPSKIRSVIKSMETKQSTLSKERFTADDLKLLFVDPEQREVLSRAWDLVEPAGTTQYLWAALDRPEYTMTEADRAVNLFIYFSWSRINMEKGFYVPHSAGSSENRAVRLRADAPDNLKERFMRASSDMIDVHWRFSQALYVFSRLNTPLVCKTPAQMRYVWPCIYTLARKAGLEEAEDIAQPSVRAGGQVNVPADLTPLLKPTNDTIARAMLLDDVDAGNRMLPISYSLHHRFVRGD